MKYYVINFDDGTQISNYYDDIGEVIFEANIMSLGREWRIDKYDSKEDFEMLQDNDE